MLITLEIPVSLESDADDDVEPAGDEQCENAEGNEVHSSDEIDNAISGNNVLHCYISLFCK